MQQGRRHLGHPVDVASGAVYATREDISIPGMVDLGWERRYSTALLDMPSTPLGPGWTTHYFATLTEATDAYHFRAPEGGVEIFSDPEGMINQGGTVRNLGTSQELVKRDNRYIVTRWEIDTGEIRRYIFKQGAKGHHWPLVSVEDITGQGLDLLYDKAGRLTGIQQRLEKRTLLLEYDDRDLVKAVSFLLPDGRQRVLASYEYNNKGVLSVAYDALSYADHYEYDANFRISREIVKDGGVFYFKYDTIGRCIKTSGLDRYDEKSFRYLESIHWTEVTDSLGHVTRFQSNQNGQIILEMNPLGAIQRTEYDEHGRVTANIDPNNGVTQYAYDASGNRSKIIDPLGHVVAFTFNDDHLPLTITDPAGNVEQRVYDRSNRLVLIENPLGKRWTFAYDGRGNLVQATDPQGARFRQEFSENGDLIAVTDWEGNLTRYNRDPFGRLERRIGPLGEVTLFHYDLLGNLLKMVLPDSTEVIWQYDSVGNTISTTDGNGNTTTFRYGPCGRLLEKKDPLTQVVRYEWGSEPRRLGRVINQRQESYLFVYDEAGRLIREKGFDGRELTFEYDQAGNCIACINGLNERVSLTLDPLGRLSKQTLPDGTCNLFEYNALGNLISAINSECEVRFEYDALGNVTKESQGDYIVQSTYDEANNLIETKTNLGHQVSYAFNGNGALSRLTTRNVYALEFIYDARGQETKRVLPGSVALEQQYDPMGRLVEQRILLRSLRAGGSPLAPASSIFVDRDYRYDRAGALAAVKDTRRGNTTYVYDRGERLIQAVRANSAHEKFSYDETGNITRITHAKEDEASLEYTSGNRLVHQGNTQYIYDENGRLIKRIEDSESHNAREWSFSWDALDQLRSVQTPDGEVWKYSYDALGRRISKQGPGKTVRFIWDRDVIIHQLEDRTLKATWIFDQETFEPLAMLSKDNFYSVICDHLGTPTELIGGDGRVVWSARYTSWGRVERNGAEGVDVPIRFQGQWFDEETGLHYTYFRYYDPRNGRFLSLDPIGMRGGENLYLYARNPVNWVDPYGLKEGGCDGGEEDGDKKPTVVRRFMSKKEYKQLRKNGLKYDPTKGSGIPTTTTSFTPKNQDVAKAKTGARSAQIQVDFNVEGLPQGPTKVTKQGLPEYPIQGDLTKDRIVPGSIRKVPK